MTTDSFTSRFENLPKLLAGTGVALAVGWVISLAYLQVNPELNFYSYSARQKLWWANALERKYPRKVVCVGASSCAFGIDGLRMLREHGVPTANFGLHAGFGATFLTMFGVDGLAPSDTLALAIEPALLQENVEPTALAYQLGLRLRRPHLASDRRLHGRSPIGLNQYLHVRPGGYHAFTVLGKILMGRPLYRYRPQDLNVSGWQETSLRLPFESVSVSSQGPSESALELLLALSVWAKQNDITVVYALPWAYASAEEMEEVQRKNLQFLQHISRLFPVVQDSTFGVISDRSLFADTHWHLTAAGAAMRSDVLARSLKAELFWTAQDLENISNRRRSAETVPVP